MPCLVCCLSRVGFVRRFGSPSHFGMLHVSGVELSLLFAFVELAVAKGLLLDSSGRGCRSLSPAQRGGDGEGCRAKGQPQGRAHRQAQGSGPRGPAPPAARSVLAKLSELLVICELLRRELLRTLPQLCVLLRPGVVMGDLERFAAKRHGEKEGATSHAWRMTGRSSWHYFIAAPRRERHRPRCQSPAPAPSRLYPCCLSAGKAKRTAQSAVVA